MDLYWRPCRRRLAARAGSTSVRRKLLGLRSVGPEKTVKLSFRSRPPAFKALPPLQSDATLRRPRTVGTMSNGFERNKADMQQTSLGFIQTELDLARTFCSISKGTDDPEKRTRNIENANQAFQSALKAFGNFGEPSDDWTSVKAALDEVERELACIR